MAANIAPEFGELHDLIGDLGRDGGLISPSVYDTAQRLRLAPPRAGVDPGIDWLISQQHEDGGWCESTVPAARDIPTLAAILAIHAYRQDEVAQRAIRRGLTYLASHAWRWSTVDINDVPLGGEMILPYLLNEAERTGFVLDRGPYARLFGMQEQKLERLARYPFDANSAPAYSWEALGLPFDPAILDPKTGVGHSPAATAAWLKASGDTPGYASLRNAAEEYLARAEGATSTKIPGVVPVVFPITGFELSYGLYALLMAGLLGHPDLQFSIRLKLEELHRVIQYHQGLSFGEAFVADVDSTAVALTVLRSAGYDVTDRFLYNFWHGDHFFTYIHEINSSVLSNAHALHALAKCGRRSPLTEAYLVERQDKDGHWDADKWHTSWRFTTLEVMNALEEFGYDEQLRQASVALLNNQRNQRYWNDCGDNGILETSYAVLALRKARCRNLLDSAGMNRLVLAHEWLADRRHGAQLYAQRWLGKVAYSPYRVDRIYYLSALLAGQVVTLLPTTVEVWAE